MSLASHPSLFVLERMPAGWTRSHSLIIRSTVRGVVRVHDRQRHPAVDQLVLDGFPPTISQWTEQLTSTRHSGAVSGRLVHGCRPAGSLILFPPAPSHHVTRSASRLLRTCAIHVRTIDGLWQRLLPDCWDNNTSSGLDLQCGL
jgi:hypothetical protein